MIFTAKEDIDAPAGAVFAVLTDFNAIEAAAMRRGADVQRTASPQGGLIGTSWRARFLLRKKPRDVALRLLSHETPTTLHFAGQTETLDGVVKFDIVALSPRRTRLAVSLEVKPRTFGARLMLQSMRLTKTKLQDRFRNRVAQMAAAIQLRALSQGKQG